MGDMGDYFNDIRDHKKRLRAKYGKPCPHCKVCRPKASPSILLPGQRCKIDKYMDPRSVLTDEQYSNA